MLCSNYRMQGVRAAIEGLLTLVPAGLRRVGGMNLKDFILARRIHGGYSSRRA